MISQAVHTQGVAHFSLALINELKIDSHCSEITLFEAARAYSAADKRLLVTTKDISIMGLMALSNRSSCFARLFIRVTKGRHGNSNDDFVNTQSRGYPR